MLMFYDTKKESRSRFWIHGFDKQSIGENLIFALVATLNRKVWSAIAPELAQGVLETLSGVTRIGQNVFFFTYFRTKGCDVFGRPGRRLCIWSRTGLTDRESAHNHIKASERAKRRLDADPELPAENIQAIFCDSPAESQTETSLSDLLLSNGSDVNSRQVEELLDLAANAESHKSDCVVIRRGDKSVLIDLSTSGSSNVVNLPDEKARRPEAPPASRTEENRAPHRYWSYNQLVSSFVTFIKKKMSIKKVLLAAVVLAVVVLALFSTPSLIINFPYKNNPFSGGVIGKTSPFEELVSKLIEKGQLRSGLSHPVERNGYEWQVWIDSVAAEGSSVAGTAAEGQTHNYGWNNIAAQASSDELEKIFEDFVSKLEIKKSSDFNDEVWMIYNNDPGGEKVVTRRRSCVVRVFIRPKKEKDNMIKSDPAESEMDGPADHRNKSPRRGPGLNK